MNQRVLAAIALLVVGLVFVVVVVGLIQKTLDTTSTVMALSGVVTALVTVNRILPKRDDTQNRDNQDGGPQ